MPLSIHEAIRLHNPDGSLMLVYLHIGGDRFIELFPVSDEASRSELPADPPLGFSHICLQSDDLHGDVEALQAQGIKFDIEPTLGLDHNWQAWLRDPDGHRIELMQLSEESLQRKWPAKLSSVSKFGVQAGTGIQSSTRLRPACLA